METLTLTSIGNIADAEKAVTEHVTGNYGSPQYIGSGCNRNAFLINDIVYKVDKRSDWRGNLDEYDRWVNRVLPVEIPNDSRIRFPSISQYKVEYDARAWTVNAMPFIDGDPADEDITRQEYKWIYDVFGMSDFGIDNARWGSDDYIYIVDMEF